MRLLPILFLAMATSAVPQVIPQPVKITKGQGVWELRATTSIVCDRAVEAEGHLLARALAPATGFNLKVVTGGAAKAGDIKLGVDAKLAKLGKEGYTLEVAAKGVEVHGSAAAGVFYGTQSLLQLLPAEIFRSSVRPNVKWTAPAMSIEDSPRFGWRGAMIDSSRHFMPKPSILRMIDAMAQQKLNTLHFHLTDDQGWRIEIKKYPKLTEVGSVRKESRIGAERAKLGYDGIIHGGFYTQEDLREIVAYAAARHITVMPEIEMPGHAQAAVASYPELGNTNEKIEVGTWWGIYKHVFNAEEKTILFLQDVLTEVLDIFPSKFVHIGGDECAKDEWKASPAAQARIKALGLKNEEELQSYIIRRMDKFLTAKGRRLVGWDEILEGGLAPGATVMSWRGTKGGIHAAREGHDVVMTPTQFTYFDYYQAKSPTEPLAIGGFLPLEKVYSSDPIPSELTPEEAKRVLGTQGQLWAEYIPHPYHMEYMAFPRLAALAEVAWTPAKLKNYDSFVERLKIQEQRWQAAGVNFRPLAKK